MPFYRASLFTPLPPTEAIARIAAATGREVGLVEALSQAFDSATRDMPSDFVGEVEGAEFRIRRRIGYRNSFLPRIRGTVASAMPGSRVDLRMSMHPFVALFMAFWLLMIGVVALPAATALPAAGASWAAWLPLGMFAFGLALALGGFYPEALKARHKLAALLEAVAPASQRPPTVSR